MPDLVRGHHPERGYATAAYRWLIANDAKASDIVVAGDSAGGGLSLSTLVALRNATDPLPAAAVCLSPWVDMEATGDSMTTRATIDPATVELLQPCVLFPAEQAARSIAYRFGKYELRSWKDANRHAGIFRCGKPAVRAPTLFPI
jgi:acetyl esterase/lipase